MEILYLVGLSVIVAITTTIHTNPYNTDRLAKLCTTACEFRNRNVVLEELDVLGAKLQAISTVTSVREPQKFVTVDKKTCNFATVVQDECWLLAIGKLENLTRLGACKNVITVGDEFRNAFIQEIAFLLQGHIRQVNAMDTLIGAYPQVAVIALYHTGNDQRSR